MNICFKFEEDKTKYDQSIFHAKIQAELQKDFLESPNGHMATKWYSETLQEFFPLYILLYFINRS